ncbi:MAG: hypothetical protein IT452_14865 [Planctomycetia bacterium]|nr:hypothetical protein [Planctomycetia bacterium]
MPSPASIVLPIACTALAFGAGTGAAFVFRPKPEPPAKVEAPKTVRAERFEAADGSGRVRGWLGVTPEGAAQVVAADAEGRARVVVTVDAKGASTVVVNGADGKPVATLSGVDGGATLALGPGERPQVTLSGGAENALAISASGQPGTTVSETGVVAGSVEVRSADGKPRVRVAADAEVGGLLELLNAAGAARARLDGRGALTLADADGKPRCALDASAESGGRVRVLAGDGKDVAVLHSPASGPALEIRAASGTPVARLQARENGTPSFALHDPSSGNVRAWLDVGDEGSTALGLYQPDGTRRQLLGLEDDGLPFHDLFDPKGVIRMSLYTRNDGDSNFDFRNAEGRNLLTLAVEPDGQGYLSISSGTHPRVFLGVLDDDATFLGLNDLEGRVRTQAFVRKDQSCGFGIRDEKGNFRMNAEADAAGRPYFQMLDDANKVRASLYLSKSFSGQLRFDDPGGIERLWLGYDDAGGVSLQFFDSSKRMRAQMGTPGSGSPFFSLHDEFRARMSLGLTTGGIPVGHLTDSNGKDRLQFGLLEDQTGRFNVLDGNDRVLWNSQ